jgi:hypothetical protein
MTESSTRHHRYVDKGRLFGQGWWPVGQVSGGSALGLVGNMHPAPPNPISSSATSAPLLVAPSGFMSRLDVLMNELDDPAGERLGPVLAMMIARLD